MGCLTPVPIRVARYVDPLRKEYDLSSFACGKCPNCVKNRARGWAFRLMREEKYCTKALFVTLTYREKYLPYSERERLPTLDYNDLRLFIMRCRKAMKAANIPEKLIYYAVGEYGSKNWRPHYHLIMMNCPEDIIVNAWMTRGANGKDAPEAIGHVHFGTVAEASIVYTCKYIAKPSRIPVFQGDDRLKETSRMSKGIGANYLTDQIIDWHKADVINRLYLPRPDGKKWALPRYYKRKIYDLEEVKLIQEYFAVMADTLAIEKTQEEWIAEAQLVNHKFELMYENYHSQRWL